MTETVTIEGLGQSGEGIAQTAWGRVYVPYALPGESVRVTCEGARGTLIDRLSSSPDRIDPICPYFGECGGCATQMLTWDAYATWKRGLLVAALGKAGLDIDVAPVHDAHGAGRRRVTFHARTIDDGTTRLGFMQARTHHIIAIEACPVLDPRLAGAISAAHAIARTLATVGKPLDVLVTATESGLDIDLRGPGKLGDGERQRLSEVAGAHDLARLSNHGVIVLERRRPLLRMGAATLEVPPGAFLQATEAGETLLAHRVVTTLAGSKRVADLFAGTGTFALRLAAQANVIAYDTEPRGLEALSKAARASEALRPVAIETRDLFRRPLQPDELARFDAVVLDPPRAGAEAQAHTLARSDIPLVVSIGCDVQSFARDAAILVAAGYDAETIEPIDQFRYSAHVEIIGVFRRKAAKKKRRLLG